MLCVLVVGCPGRGSAELLELKVKVSEKVKRQWIVVFEGNQTRLIKAQRKEQGGELEIKAVVSELQPASLYGAVVETESGRIVSSKLQPKSAS
jgi:hypothetical protein